MPLNFSVKHVVVTFLLAELTVADRRQKREIRQLEQELHKWQVLVDSITGEKSLQRPLVVERATEESWKDIVDGSQAWEREWYKSGVSNLRSVHQYWSAAHCELVHASG